MRRLHLLLSLSYPPAVHFALISAHAEWALWFLVIVSMSQLMLIIAHPRERGWMALVPVTILLLCIHGLLRDTTVALYLPPFIIQGSLLWLFASSLRQGQEPLLTRIARRVFQQHDEETRRYTTRVTQLWSLFFVALLLETLLLTLFAPLELWSLFANIINYLLIVLLFSAEFTYRRLRFTQRTSLHQFVQLFAATDWPALLKGKGE